MKEDNVSIKLFAFWRYDLFPYVLGAPVTKMCNSGVVYAPSYQGWFRPLLLLPLHAGQELKEKIEKLRLEYSVEGRKYKKLWNERLARELPYTLLTPA